MVEFNDITLSAGKQKKRGTLSWNAAPGSVSTTSIDFRSKTSNKPISIRLTDISSFLWSQQFDGYQWKIGLQGGTIVKFAGLNESAFKDIELLAKDRGMSIHRETVATKGANAGTLELTDQNVVFSVDGNVAFELPMHLIAQAVAQSRNEVALELVHDEEATPQQGELLVEMRVYIPDAPKVKKEDEDGNPIDESDADEDEDEETPSQLFARDLQIRGDIGLTSSSSLASFEKLLFAVPRGKYDVELFPTFLKLQSQTYTYKINYKNINKMFLFDLTDQNNHLFVIGLNPPVRQGRTAYPYLVVQFDNSEYLEQKFPAIDEKTAEEKYGGLMKPYMKGPSHDVVTRVFKALTKKKVLIPGHSFVSTRGGASIQCSYKANEGHLFFLEKSFFFLKKPPMHIRHASITSIEFDHMSSANKRFGMKISVNEQKVNEYMFTNIDREEFDRVYTFLQDKNIQLIRNGEEDQMQPSGSRSRGRGNDDYSEDPYMKRLDADAEGGGGEGGDESDSENDEDFTVGSDASSEDDSDDDEEDNSEIEEEKKQRKRKSAAKKKKSDDGMDEDEDDAGKKKSGKGKRKRESSDEEEEQKVTPYSLYQKATRPIIMAENPGTDTSKANSMCMARWREESKEARRQYEEEAEKLNARQRKKKAASASSESDASSDASSSSDDGQSKKKKKKRNVDPNAPKRPPNAYFLYQTAVRSTLPANLTVGEKAKKMGDQWKNLSASEKKEYEEKSVVLKAQYAKDLAAYEQGKKGGAAKKKNGSASATAAKTEVIEMSDDEEEGKDVIKREEKKTAPVSAQSKKTSDFFKPTGQKSSQSSSSTRMETEEKSR